MCRNLSWWHSNSMTASNPPALPSLTFPAVSQAGRLASALFLILQVFFSIWSSFPSQSVYLARSQRGLIPLDRSGCLPPSALQLHPQQRLTPSCKHEVHEASVSLTSDTSDIYQRVSSVVIRCLYDDIRYLRSAFWVSNTFTFTNESQSFNLLDQLP